MLKRLFQSADRLIAAGNQAEREGKLPEACERYREAVRISPGNAKAHLNLGIGLEAMGDTSGAIAAHQAALANDPAEPFASYNLGRLLFLRGELQDAERLLSQALRSRPQFPEAHIVLASVLQAQRQHAPALAVLETALKQRPDDLGALHRKAECLAALDLPEQAQAVLERILIIAPDDAEAKAQLAQLRARLSDLHLARGNLTAAAAELEAVLALRPDWADALFNYGCTLRRLMRTAEAEAAFRRAIAVNPAHGAAYRMLGSALRAQCRTEEALALYREAREHCPEDLELASAELYVLLGDERIAEDALFARHAAFGEAIERAYPARLRFDNSPDPERRLRIGYVSDDFRYHVVTLFMLPVLERRNRRDYEVYCYSTTEAADGYTRMVAAHTDAWRDCAGASDLALAERVTADGIDILVDLSGHSGIPRLRVFAQRPAPIQATWLGYLGTTGMTRMHYRISDRFADPPGTTEQYHSERLARLPHSQWCYRPFISVEATSTPPCLKNGHITFGSFNQVAKISASTRRLWAHILAQVPDARLVIAGVPPGPAHDALQRDLALSSAVAERLTLLPYVSLQDYFRLFNTVDIALDTMPYSGGTTTCDALWMGVPVITAPGARPASRSAASILSTAGLPEWISPSPDEYVHRAVAFARNREKLPQIRSSLRERLSASALMDEAGFAADLEALYRGMWRRWCAAPQ